MKLLLLLGGLGLMTACVGSTRPHRTSATAPHTRIDPVTDVLHGVSIVDNYRWLEGDNTSPADQGKVTAEVAAWTDAQNQYTRQVLDNLPGRAALENRLRPLMEVGSVTAPHVRANRYFFTKREGSENQAVVYWREGVSGESRVLIDPAALDSTGLTTVEWVSPSPDGRTVAYGTYRAGDENTTLHLLDVDTRNVLPLQIPSKTQAPDWLPDGSGFVYQNLKNAKDPYSGQVMFHRMGEDVSRDVACSSGSSPRPRTRNFRQRGDRSGRFRATAAGSCSATGWTRSPTTSGWWTSSGFFAPAGSNGAWYRSAPRGRRSARSSTTR